MIAIFLLTFVCAIWAQTEAVEHFAELAMKICKKKVKDTVGQGDGTIWHFSKYLCSTLQDQIEEYFTQQIAVEAEGLSKKPSNADKHFEQPALTKAATTAINNIVDKLIKDKVRDPQQFETPISAEFEPVFFRHLITGKPNQKKSEAAPEKQEGPVTVLVGNTFKQIVNDATTDVFVEFYAPWCGHCQKLEPIWNDLATKFAGKPILIAKINAQANDVPREFNVNGFPTLYYIKADQKDKPILYEGGRDLKDFMRFIAENRSTKDYELPEMPKMKSEAKPASTIDEHGVTVAVGTTFDDVIMKSDKDVFIEFYAPWCGHCKNLAPKWNELAGKLKGLPIVIAKYDADSNDVPAPFSVSGFPTLYYLRADRKKKPITFDLNDRDVSGFLKFIEKHRSDKSWTIPTVAASTEKSEL